ncbi:MAG: IS21 family transposase [Chthoniobacterales bacterium]|nr:IS21 family transposase [Chthoniobacterales bacterium]
MSNILEVSHQQLIQGLAAKGWSVRQIARTLSLNRRTVHRYADAAVPKCTTEVTTGPEAPPDPKYTTEVTTGPEIAPDVPDSKCTTQVTTGSAAPPPPPDDPKCTTPPQVTTGPRSVCGAFEEVILPMLEIGLSAQRIYQDLVAAHGFGWSYPSVRRYVARLKASEPGRVWRIECAPGEELQVDFGLGAPLVEPGGKTRRTWLFRAVLSHSRKGYSEVVLRQDTATFLRVIENAVRYFGGVPRLLNFDNLKAAVIKADWYDPTMNPQLADFCRHYGMTPMPCRAYTPQHKGKVERGVAYAKNNALKGRQFVSLAAQNAHLQHWEEQVADKRVHGTTRRQVAAVFDEERKALGPLPASLYECYQEGRRRVQRDSFVEVAKAYYEAPPEFIGRQVWVRHDGRMVRLFNDRMEQIASHTRLDPGKFSRTLGVRGLHGTITESAAYWQSRAAALGEAAGRWAQRALDTRGAEALRSIMGLCQLHQKHRASDINAACLKAMAAGSGPPSFRAVKHLLEAGAEAPVQLQMELRETDPIIRPLTAYTEFIHHQAPGGGFPHHEVLTPPKPPAGPPNDLPNDLPNELVTAPPAASITEHQITAKKAS